MLVAYGNPDMFSNAERGKTVRISIDVFRPVQNSLNGMYNTKKTMETSGFVHVHTYRCTIFSTKGFLKKLARIYAMEGYLEPAGT